MSTSMRNPAPTINDHAMLAAVIVTIISKADADERKIEAA